MSEKLRFLTRECLQPGCLKFTKIGCTKIQDLFQCTVRWSEILFNYLDLFRAKLFQFHIS